MKKKRVIITLLISILLAAILLFIIIKVNKKSEEPSKIVVKNGLSINYLNGDVIETNNKQKTYTFSITNDSTFDKYYQINLKDLKIIDDVKYDIECEETKFKKESNSFLNETVVEYAVITPGETHTYNMTVTPTIKKVPIGTLDIDEYTFTKEYFSQTIIANSIIYQNPKSTPGTDISTIDEGLIQDLDDDGVTYYFRGNVTNNYFKFADLMWRIVRINGNNTIKIVLDSTTGELIQYYNDLNKDYFKYNNTNIKNYLTTWYNDNLKMYDKYIYNGKLCDYTLYTGSTDYVFEASQRLSINHAPTFNCLGTKINSKIMLLTADEIEYAGGLIGVANNNYYLYKSDILNPSWTITPAKGNANEFYPYALGVSGALEDGNVGSQQRSIRPVINIMKNVTVSGDGTYDNPYVITN